MLSFLNKGPLFIRLIALLNNSFCFAPSCFDCLFNWNLKRNNKISLTFSWGQSQPYPGYCLSASDNLVISLSCKSTSEKKLHFSVHKLTWERRSTLKMGRSVRKVNSSRISKIYQTNCLVLRYQISWKVANNLCTCILILSGIYRPFILCKCMPFKRNNPISS